MKFLKIAKYILAVTAFVSLSLKSFGLNPVITSPSSTQTVLEDNNLVFNAATSTEISISDPENNDQTVTIASTNGTFTLSQTTGLSGVSGNGTGSLSFSGSIINVNAALDGCFYRPSLNYNGSASISISTNDGTGGTDAATINITVTPVNDAPVLGGASGGFTYTESDPATVIASGITVTHADNTNLVGATVTITGLVNAEDVLSANVSLPLTASYDPNLGVLTITGSGTAIQYRDALRTVKYDNTNDSVPDTSTRTVTFLVDDGQLNGISNPVTRTITVVGVNDAPIAINDVYSGVLEGGTLNVSAANGVLINDRDADGPPPMTVSKIANVQFGTLSLDPDGSFTYVHNGSQNLVDFFTYKTSDALSAQSNIANVQITITGVNDPPVLSQIESSPLSFIEDGTAKVISSTIVVKDTDNLNLASAVIQIFGNYQSSEDSLYFTPQAGLSTAGSTPQTINVSGNAPLAVYQTFLRNIKYKNYNKSNPSVLPRTISFNVNDGSLSSNTASRQITITPVNDPPVASNTVILGTSNYFIGDHLTGDYTFTDPDGDLEGASTYNWYSSPNSNGIPISSISGAVKDTFTLHFSDGGKYISFGVHPKDFQGLAGVSDTSLWHYVNAAPVFTDTTIHNIVNPGTYAVGETVSSAFVYFDKEGNAAGAHQYQWYRSPNSSGSGALPIAGATTANYTITNSDTSKFIALQVIPKAAAGSTPGRTYRSDWVSVSKLPSASLISGIDSICNFSGSKDILHITLKSSNPPVSYIYQLNNNPAVTVAGVVGENNLTVSDTGTYKLIKVFDNKYSFGTLISTTAKVSYYKKPTASMDLDTMAICSGDSSIHGIPVTLSGKSPWRIIYKKGSVVVDSILNISSAKTNIPVTISQIGKYTVSNVKDGNGCTSVGTKYTFVKLMTEPIASITGNFPVCPADTAKISIGLTGAGPWKFDYTTNGIDSNRVNNVTTSTYLLKTTIAGTYRIKHVYDKNNKEGCSTGSAVVSNYTVPTATISGTYSTCEGVSTAIDVHLTGNTNWKIFYSLNGGKADSVIASIPGPGPFTYPLSVSKQGNYSITKVSDVHCKGTGSGTANLSIVPAPEVSILGLDTVYLSTPIISYAGSFSPSGGSYAASDKPDAIIKNGSNFNYWPAIAGIGKNMVRYQYQDNTTHCIGKDSILITVLEKNCEIHAREISLDTLDKFCFNFSPFLIEGVKKVGDPTPGRFSISRGLVPINYGLDTVNVSPNTAYLRPDVIQTGSVTVTYFYKLKGVTQQSDPRTFTFEKIDGAFKWDNECFNGATVVNFSDTSQFETGSNPVSHKWKINNHEYDASKVKVTFNSAGTYPVNYVVVSNFGCTDTINKNLVLKPTFKVGSLPYAEDFQDGQSDWIHLPADSLKNSTDSWKLARPVGNAYNNMPVGSMAWYTDIKNVRNEEQSEVISPCFDFTNSERPMIKMNIWRGFGAANDGANLQYTTDNGEKWTPVGTTDDGGIEWYNNALIDGNPGNSSIGWSQDGDHDNSWQECRHTLDKLVGKTNVRFKIAYGSPGVNTPRNGLAFDNFWIGERTKKILIEHFTNSGSAACFEADNSINNVVNNDTLDAIDLQYHLSDPAPDTFYYLNPVVADSRQYYYQVNGVPYALIDGGRNNNPKYLFDFNPKNILQKDITEAVLKDNKFQIDLETRFIEDVVTISIDLKALDTISNRTITLYVAVIESVINDFTGQNGENAFENVVRDLVPGTDGTGFINRTWMPGSTEHVDLDWNVLNIFNRKNIRIVAYVQDEGGTKEVYQAVIDNPSTYTDIKETPVSPASGFMIYPNPASDFTLLEFNDPLKKDVSINIMDNLGRLVRQEKMKSSESLKNLSLNGLDAGIYIVNILSKDSILGTTKLIIVSGK